MSRKTPWLKAEEHLLAANIDMVFLVAGLDADFNPRRLERYLTAAWDSGADPVIVLTKLDVCDDFEKLAEAEDVAVGVPVLAVSNVTGEGIDEVRALLRPARTFVLLGSSGAGKSTLVNRLAGRTLMPTGDLRRDGRGRHTTRHRQLLVLKSGAILIDTPGLRELQIWEGDVDSAFSDIAELAAQCRFSDCAHATEPDCAVRRRSRRESSIRRAGRTTTSFSGKCVRSRPGAACGSGASSSSAGGRVPERRDAPAGTGGSRERDYFLTCVTQYSVAEVGGVEKRAFTAYSGCRDRRSSSVCRSRAAILRATRPLLRFAAGEIFATRFSWFWAT